MPFINGTNHDQLRRGATSRMALKRAQRNTALAPCLKCGMMHANRNCYGSPVPYCSTTCANSDRKNQ